MKEFTRWQVFIPIIALPVPRPTMRQILPIVPHIPMLHLLREESIEKALVRYPNPENIPENNIHFARKKGFAYMNMLRDSCLKS